LFWHVRTYVLIGNPIYPANLDTAGKSHSAVDGSRPSIWTRHLLYPWVAHFDGHKVLESPSANPLGFYFVFFCVCWGLTRRRDYSRADLGVIAFLVIYYAYWVYIWGVLRYAIAPILLAALLLAERVTTVSQQNRSARRVTAVLFAYCVGFALLPTLILQVNAFQFSYFAGSLDRAGYLRATMADYRPIEVLNQHAAPGERTLSVNNCAAAYAYDPSKFRCVRLTGEFSDEKAFLIHRMVSSTKPDFLMLPTEFSHDKLLAPLNQLGYRTPIYQDDRFLLIPRTAIGR